MSWSWDCVCTFCETIPILWSTDILSKNDMETEKEDMNDNGEVNYTEFEDLDTKTRFKQIILHRKTT